MEDPEAEDGYRVVFSLAELDSAFLDAEVLVTDTMGWCRYWHKPGSVEACCAT